MYSLLQIFTSAGKGSIHVMRMHSVPTLWAATPAHADLDTLETGSPAQNSNLQIPVVSSLYCVDQMIVTLLPPLDEVDDDTRTTTRGTKTRGTKSPKKGTKSHQTDPNTPRGRHGRRADTLCRQQDDSSRSTRRTTKKTKTRRT